MLCARLGRGSVFIVSSRFAGCRAAFSLFVSSNTPSHRPVAASLASVRLFSSTSAKASASPSSTSSSSPLASEKILVYEAMRGKRLTRLRTFSFATLTVTTASIPFLVVFGNPQMAMFGKFLVGFSMWIFSSMSTGLLHFLTCNYAIRIYRLENPSAEIVRKVDAVTEAEDNEALAQQAVMMEAEEGSAAHYPPTSASSNERTVASDASSASSFESISSSSSTSSKNVPSHPKRVYYEIVTTSVTGRPTSRFARLDQLVADPESALTNVGSKAALYFVELNNVKDEALARQIDPNHGEASSD